MTEHKVGTREEWLRRPDRAPRAREGADPPQRRACARAPRAALGARRGALQLRDDEGTKTLAELFEGRSQLLVFHLMFGPEDAEACPGCSFMADHVDGAVVHLNHRDVTFVAVSRAPLEKLSAYKRRMGWRLPWVSAFGTDFNIDFAVFTEEERRTGTRVQLRLATEGRPQRPGGGVARPERLRARGRGRLPQLLVLRPRHGRRCTAPGSCWTGPRRDAATTSRTGRAATTSTT